MHRHLPQRSAEGAAQTEQVSLETTPRSSTSSSEFLRAVGSSKSTIGQSERSSRTMSSPHSLPDVVKMRRRDLLGPPQTCKAFLKSRTVALEARTQGFDSPLSMNTLTRTGMLLSTTYRRPVCPSHRSLSTAPPNRIPARRPRREKVASVRSTVSQVRYI